MLAIVAALSAEDVHPLIPGLTIATPPGWTVVAGEAGSVVLRAPVEPAPAGEAAGEAAARARARPSIAVAVDGDMRHADAKAVMDASLAALARLVPDFAVTEPAIEVVIHDRRWQRARYRFATGEVTWDQVLLAGAGASGGICITCSTTADRAAAWQPVFAAALATVGRPASRVTP